MKVLKVTTVLAFGLALALLSQGEQRLFWERNGKKLASTATIQEVRVNIPEECLSVCLYDDRCKSCNVDLKTMMCHLFEEDRCVPGRLIDAKNSNYYDMVAEGQCPSQSK